MNYKPLIIVLGQPYSIFPEIFFKSYKYFIQHSFKHPVILIGSLKLIQKQMKYFKYSFKINEITDDDVCNIQNNKQINIINVEFDSKKIFETSKKNSVEYIDKCFQKALLIKEKTKLIGIINGPISKKKFLAKRYLGITEYIASKTKTDNFAMLIYNKKLSVCPLTTHLPLKYVAKKITKSLIIKKVKLVNKFYNKILSRKPKIAILGLNPHCESIDKYSEEENIILPAIKYLKKNKIIVSGPYSADTFFLKNNYENFDLVFGMYHDQVLTPIKTLFEFDAINITIGLPFLRVSPDHGPNESMIGKGKSNPLSLIKSIKFFKSINEI